mgnify:CR=1 FL=1
MNEFLTNFSLDRTAVTGFIIVEDFTRKGS